MLTTRPILLRINHNGFRMVPNESIIGCNRGKLCLHFELSGDKSKWKNLSLDFDLAKWWKSPVGNLMAYQLLLSHFSIIRCKGCLEGAGSSELKSLLFLDFLWNAKMAAGCYVSVFPTAKYSTFWIHGENRVISKWGRTERALLKM